MDCARTYTIGILLFYITLTTTGTYECLIQADALSSCVSIGFTHEDVFEEIIIDSTFLDNTA
jgi:hypothetical protein